MPHFISLYQEEKTIPHQKTDILLVDDHPADRELARLALQEYNRNYQITVAKDGREAIAVLSKVVANGSADEIPKLVLLDLNLPFVSGLEVLRTIKGSPVTRSIPVVVMTSSQEDKDLQDSYRLGANSYIIKPLDTAHFAKAIKQIGAYWLLVNQQKD